MIKHLKEQTNYKVIIACSSGNQIIFKKHKFIDKIVVFDSSKFNPKDLINNIKELRKEKASISIDTSQSSNISAILSWLTAKTAIGFKKTRGKLRNYVYNHSIELNPDKHMIYNYFDLLKSVASAPPKCIKLIKLPCGKTKYKNLIILHPCTAISQKKWQQHKWVKVMEYLAKNNKIALIGSKEEAPMVKRLLNKVSAKAKRKILNLSGKIELDELINIINQSKLFIGIDGGPAHITASAGVPVVGLFGYETPVRYGPFNKNSISIYKNLPCSPCIKAYNNQWPDCTNPICMKRISAEEVIKAIEKLI